MARRIRITRSYDPRKVRVTGPKPAASPAEVARIRRMAKRAGLTFGKTRGKGWVYVITGPFGSTVSTGLRSIEQRIREAGQKPKPHHKRN